MITKLKENEIFVFGSNERGIHGAGAAFQAYKEFGAKWGIPFGLVGQTFAIPTKDMNIQTLPLEKIQEYVEKFIKFAEGSPQYKFLVTEIGCGLAGYQPEDIAPLFKRAVEIENIHLPEKFKEILNEHVRQSR